MMKKLVKIFLPLVLTLGAIYLGLLGIWANAQTTEPFVTFVLGLPSASSLTGTELLYLSQGGVSKKLALSQIPGASLTIPDQTISGGANDVPFAIGTVSSGTTTIDCGKNQNQFLTDGGAFTLAAPGLDGNCLVLIQNNASAGTVTFSGFTVGGNTGDPIDTVNGHKFSAFIWRINGVAGYRIAAHQ